MQKPNQTSTSGQNTSVGGIQAQPATYQSKAVASGLAQGAGAPMVRAHCPQLRSASPCSGGAFNVGGDSCMWYFPKI